MLNMELIPRSRATHKSKQLLKRPRGESMRVLLTRGSGTLGFEYQEYAVSVETRKSRPVTYAKGVDPGGPLTLQRQSLVLEVLNKLGELKYFDDQRFASIYVRSKLIGSKWGRLKIRNGSPSTNLTLWPCLARIGAHWRNWRCCPVDFSTPNVPRYSISRHVPRLAPIYPNAGLVRSWKYSARH